jgi:hypothetical protein
VDGGAVSEARRATEEAIREATEVDCREVEARTKGRKSSKEMSGGDDMLTVRKVEKN